MKKRRTPDAATVEAAKAAAVKLRERLGHPASGELSVMSVCKALGIVIKRVDFDWEKAGTDTLLVPHEGGYTVAISSRASLTAAEKRFRIGHEIGHTLFYEHRGGDDTPHRRAPSTEWEEEFCDAFSVALFAS